MRGREGEGEREGGEGEREGGEGEREGERVREVGKREGWMGREGESTNNQVHVLKVASSTGMFPSTLLCR